jgi:N-acetylglucosaminyldiphosphoundecaprenol N-acetyl-beta-D-mannosaminyltransferase
MNTATTSSFPLPEYSATQIPWIANPESMQVRDTLLSGTAEPWIAPPISEVWGLPFHALTMSGTLEAIDRWIAKRIPGYAITANLNYAMLCDHDPKLTEFTRKAALVLCDGMPIYWRSCWNRCRLPERVAGSDLIYRLSQRCAERGYRIYFYGAAEGIAQRTAEKLCELYPALQVAGWQSPPFGNVTEDQVQRSLDHIRDSQPDLLLVALGQPKGEFWIQQHYQSLNVPLSMQVGASFDFVAGVWRRAPKLFQRTGLEWLHRACSDPIRLVPRYFKNFVFLIQALRKDGIEVLSENPVAPSSAIESNPRGR